MPRKMGETSYYETAFGIIPRSKLIPLEIEGIKRAWDFVLKKRNSGMILITPESFKEIHAVGFGWIFPEVSGRFRTIEVEVSRHTPPKFFTVPQLMLDFCRDLDERARHLPKLGEAEFFDELVGFIAWAHHRFLWIHPFKDYNGRIARLLINIILLNLDLPPVELKVETAITRRKYIHALQDADKGEFAALERLIRQGIGESASALKGN